MFPVVTLYSLHLALLIHHFAQFMAQIQANIPHPEDEHERFDRFIPVGKRRFGPNANDKVRNILLIGNIDHKIL